MRFSLRRMLPAFMATVAAAQLAAWPFLALAATPVAHIERVQGSCEILVAGTAKWVALQNVHRDLGAGDRLRCSTGGEITYGLMLPGTHVFKGAPTSEFLVPATSITSPNGKGEIGGRHAQADPEPGAESGALGATAGTAVGMRLAILRSMFINAADAPASAASAGAGTANQFVLLRSSLVGYGLVPGQAASGVAPVFSPEEEMAIVASLKSNLICSPKSTSTMVCRRMDCDSQDTLVTYDRATQSFNPAPHVKSCVVREEHFEAMVKK